MTLRLLALLARAAARIEPRALALGLWAVLALACSRDEQPVTQVLLTVDADPGVVEQFSAVEVSTYAADAPVSAAAPAAADVHRFEIAADQPAHEQLPFSLGIDKREASRFLLVVAGYSGGRMVIERKARVSFVAGQTRPLEMYLAQGCLGQLCGDVTTGEWLTRSCDPGHDNACAPIMVQEGDAFSDRDGGTDQVSQPSGLADGGERRADAGGVFQPIDAGTARTDGAATPDSDPCAKNPCGVANTCARTGSDYQCTCGSGAFQVDAKRCIAKFSALAVGDIHACAIRTDRTVACWGSNQWGQLGSDSPLRNPKPIPVPGVSDAIAISAATESTCIIRADHSAACWGLNNWGELGDGTTTPSLSPVTVKGLSNVAQISASGTNACALTMDGALTCWGGNHNNVLLLGEITTFTSRPQIQNAPITIAGVPNAIEVDVGFASVCARVNDGSTICWGANGHGQLGDGRTLVDNLPTRVNGLSAVELSTGDVTCARKADGSVVCAGENEFGQLGNGSTVDSALFVPVTGLNDAVELSVGLMYTCARKASGSVACWGKFDPESSDGGVVATPTPIAGVSDAVQIGTGQTLGCALKKDGTIVCWGANRQGQLGDGSGSIASKVPVTVLAY